MLKIGDFSRLSQVSVKTLRYYDEVALLKPTQVDEVSGYRYYSMAQLRQLHRILALRDLGFSLDQPLGFRVRFPQDSILLLARECDFGSYLA
jgi:hypothetical protein